MKIHFQKWNKEAHSFVQRVMRPGTVSASATVSLSIDSYITACSTGTQSSNKLGMHMVIRG